MNCEEFQNYIDAYIDNELEVAATILVQHHLRDCARCHRLLETRNAVRALLSNPEIRFEVPDALLGKIQSALPAVRSHAKPPSIAWFPISWFSVPFALAATVAVMLGLVFLNRDAIFDHARANNILAQEVISSHVRSLLATHLLDVPSTDQHTVKPWFNGKLKFSPPVQDFADHGFRLIGGRLDYVNGQEVAALVYQRNRHVINMFVWPSESVHTTAAETFTRDGYNIFHWNRNGFEYWAVSDVNAEDLKTFTALQMQQS